MIKQDASSYCLVMVTVASEQEGEKIAKALLTEQLAACVSITPVNSFYTWQEKINRDREWQLFIKTKLALFPELAQTIQTLHGYEVPEIIALPIIAGFQPYLNWIVVSGTAKVICNGQEQLLMQNQSTYVPMNTPHRVENPGVIPLVMIEVQNGEYLGDDDIIRFAEDS